MRQESQGGLESVHFPHGAGCCCRGQELRHALALQQHLHPQVLFFFFCWGGGAGGWLRREGGGGRLVEEGGGGRLVEEGR